MRHHTHQQNQHKVTFLGVLLRRHRISWLQTSNCTCAQTCPRERSVYSAYHYRWHKQWRTRATLGQLPCMCTTPSSRQLSSQNRWCRVLQSVWHGSLWTCTSLPAYPIRNPSKSCLYIQMNSLLTRVYRFVPCSKLSNTPTSPNILSTKRGGTCVA